MESDPVFEAVPNLFEYVSIPIANNRIELIKHILSKLVCKQTGSTESELKSTW